MITEREIRIKLAKVTAAQKRAFNHDDDRLYTHYSRVRKILEWILEIEVKK